ncbi:MAG TPA: hypothetical protein VGL24_11185 [Chthoniobacterales bacterium]
MEQLAEEFRKWVLDPARTNDELLPVISLIYWGRVVWGGKHKQPYDTDYDARRAEAKQRRLNPALRPAIDRTELDAAVEMWAEVKKFDNHWASEDRVLRNLEAFRFFPHLEEVSLEEAEVPDLSPLAGLSGLRTLSIREPVLLGGHVVADLRPLAGLPIEKLNLSLRRPWVDFGVLAELPKLRELSLMVNLIALEGVGTLPEVEIATLDCDFHWKTPARSLHALPAMPRIQRLKVGGVASLEGVDRLTEARNLDLIGTYSDLAPLASLSQVTFLRLKSERFSDLTPLARMPALRELLIVREIPFDLSPLAESASLREVRVERCDIIATELAAVNAALNPDQNDFLADPPRPLPPLRFINYYPQHAEIAKLNQEFPRAAGDEPRARGYGADAAISAAEARWGAEQVRARLSRLLGDGYGGASGYGSAGHLHVNLNRYQDVIRLLEVVEELRKFSVSSRYPWNFLIVTEPHGDMSEDMAEKWKRDARKKKPGHWLVREFDAEEERRDREEWNEARQEDYQRLEAEHRLQLKEEQQVPVDPADFAPASKPPTDGGAGTTAVKDHDDADSGEDDGDLMEAEPGEEIEDELTEKLRVVLTLTENILWCTSHMRDGAEYLMGEPAEDWHSFSEPIQNRPRPDRA